MPDTYIINDQMQSNVQSFLFRLVSAVENYRHVLLQQELTMTKHLLNMLLSSWILCHFKYAFVILDSVPFCSNMMSSYTSLNFFLFKIASKFSSQGKDFRSLKSSFL